MPEIQPLQTAIGAHSNHDAIATAKIICKPPGAKFAQVWNLGKAHPILYAYKSITSRTL
jgi:hypothetical protein